MCLVAVSTSSPLVVHGQASGEGFGNFIEGYMKDMFRGELTSASESNMTDCMTRLLCENICNRASKGDFKEGTYMNSAQLLGTPESDPLGYFFTGGDRGFEYGKQKQCHLCMERYKNCHPAQYDQVKASSGTYETKIKDDETLLGHDFLDDL